MRQTPYAGGHANGRSPGLLATLLGAIGIVIAVLGATQWMLNAAVNPLHDKMDGIETDISDLETDISKLETDIGVLGERMTRVETHLGIPPYYPTETRLDSPAAAGRHQERQ